MGPSVPRSHYDQTNNSANSNYVCGRIRQHQKTLSKNSPCNKKTKSSYQNIKSSCQNTTWYTARYDERLQNFIEYVRAQDSKAWDRAYLEGLTIKNADQTHSDANSVPTKWTRALHSKAVFSVATHRMPGWWTTKNDDIHLKHWTQKINQKTMIIAATLQRT